ncbi:MAG: HNH endonuclease [bacterium]
MKYTTKDSGKRQEYDSGMRRDTLEGKPRYDLIYIPMLTRLAELHARGVAKYGEEIEEWRAVPSLNDIEASNFGNIRNSKTNIIYSKWVNKHGYELVSLSKQKRKHYQVHRLVMEAFVGNSNMQVNHKDFNRTNNRIDNLEYMSMKDNIKYSKDNDRYIGSLNNATITFEIAEEIRKRICLGEKQKKLAKEYGISPQTVCDINKRRIWNENVKIHKNLNARNWELANSKEELDRFKGSAFRHFIQWFQDEEDEDHAAAVLFNINAAEMVKTKLKDGKNENRS